MVKVSKTIKIFPNQYRPVTLSVEDADNYTECDKLLLAELKRYNDLLTDDDKRLLNKILGGNLK